MKQKLYEVLTSCYPVQLYRLHSRNFMIPAPLFYEVNNPIASSLLQAIKTCCQACSPGYLMHFS